MTESTYTWPAPAGVGTELGATVRVPHTPFSLGATRLTTSTKFNAAFQSATSQGNAQDLHRTQEALHFEIGVSVGGDKGEFAVFAGPSVLKATQALLTTVHPTAQPYSSQDHEQEPGKGLKWGSDAQWR